MTDFSIKILQIPEVVNYETGEVLKPAGKLEIKTREEVGFRSLTDLKGFSDNEKPQHVSIVNTEDYVPVKKLVDMIFRGKTKKEQAILTAKLNAQNADDYDEDNEVEIIDDIVEQSDVIEDLTAVQNSSGVEVPSPYYIAEGGKGNDDAENGAEPSAQPATSDNGEE